MYTDAGNNNNNNNNASTPGLSKPFVQAIPGQEELRQAILATIFLNLVFEGGGGKGILYAGILAKLESEGILAKIRNVGGSSAGGIIAYAVALGYSASEILKITSELDFTKLQDTKTTTKVLNAAGKGAAFVAGTGVNMLTQNVSVPVAALSQGAATLFNESRSPLGLGEAFSLLKDNYLWEGDEVLRLARKLAVDKGFDPEMTFLQHHQLIESARYKKNNGEELSEQEQRALLSKDLFLTGTRVDSLNHGSQTFSWKDTPEVKMVDALRATMSFPFAFKPYPITINGVTHFYMDGGAKNNYPMNMFDCEDSDFLFEAAKLIKVGKGGNGDTKERWINPCTLGCKVDSSLECASLFYSKYAIEQLGGSPKLAELLNSLMINSNEGVGTYYRFNTIQGLDLDMATLNFALTPLEKLAMISSGLSSVEEYVAQRDQGFPMTGESISERGLKMATLAKDLVAISNDLKKLDAVNLENILKTGDVLDKIKKDVSKLIHDFKDQDPAVAVNIGKSLLIQLEGMSWASGSLSTNRTKAWVELKNEVRNTTNAIQKDAVPGELDPGWGTVVGPTAMGTVLAGGAALLFPPLILPVVFATGWSIFKARQADPNSRLEDPRLTEFRNHLKANTTEAYAKAMEILKTSEGATALMLKETNDYIDTFWRDCPQALMNLEEALVQKLSTERVKDEANKAAFEACFLRYISNDKKWYFNEKYATLLLANDAVNDVLCKREGVLETPLVRVIKLGKTNLAVYMCKTKDDINQDYVAALDAFRSYASHHEKGAVEILVKPLVASISKFDVAALEKYKK